MMETFKALKPSQEKCHSISSLKSDIVVPKQEHIVEQSQPPLGPLQKMPTPLPVDQVDYPDAVYWTQQSWQDYSQQREQKGEKVKKLGFICTEDGEFVGAVRIKTDGNCKEALESPSPPLACSRYLASYFTGCL